ncbi:Surfeit locus protein 1 [Mizuhopecten yessoensis]|uniref:SURF1-like protein n=2 Tax=Mizuhopecten yessoensis TaxID=6573 RepID=A0A210QV34_MIZYE|nr:Surfeit locus protein 1 [Mizuhopecten yessoensis]
MDNIRSLRSTPRKTPSTFRRRLVLSDSVIFAVPVGLCLGTALFYQTNQKDTLFLEEQIKQEPIPLPYNMEGLSETEMKYRRIKVIGEFDHTMERYIRPRELVKDEDSQSNLLVFKKSEKCGLLVVTPFTLKDTGERILINRGWIPKNKKDPSSRLKGQIKGEVELVGTLQQSERERFILTNSLGNDPHEFYTRDVESLAKSTNSLPVYLDAVSDSTVEGGPIGGQITIDLKPHLAYYLSVLYLLAILFCVVSWYRRKYAPVKFL